MAESEEKKYYAICEGCKSLKETLSKEQIESKIQGVFSEIFNAKKYRDETISSDYDFDELIVPGIYAVNTYSGENKGNNYPTSTMGALFVILYNGVSPMQIIFTYNAILIRRKSSDWSGWNKVSLTGV